MTEKLALTKVSHTKFEQIKFDNIIVWRHAEAEPADFELGENDDARQLTHKGQSQAKRMARWLKQHLPDETRMICSPAVRALQTAEALDDKIQLHDALKPSASLADVLAVLIQLQHQKNPPKNVLIVGHQPWMGQLVSYLFEQAEASAGRANRENNTSIKKGAVWWLRLHSNDNHLTTNRRYKLFTLQTPSLL
ncbi:MULTISPECIES: phosphohistidine phosphatase SixA [Methylotenera]|uniref:phosphohistidine phosphatase SixA n=1 Tax=Methylotenera TaxID=359407 RepID=UPI000371D7E2|nr:MULTISPECIES: phosphohistidine phosphatase SixA [Methylotenera]